MAYFAGNEKLYMQTLREYKKVHGMDLQGIRSALKAGEQKNASRVAHSLKSSSAVIGAEPLAAVALKAEKALDGSCEYSADNVESILAALEIAFRKLMAELESIPEPELQRGGPLDRERALALIEKLVPLLQSSEAIVFTMRDEIEEVFSPFGDDGEEVLNHIDMFEFPEAARILLKIKSTL